MFTSKCELNIFNKCHNRQSILDEGIYRLVGIRVQDKYKKHNNYGRET